MKTQPPIQQGPKSLLRIDQVSERIQLGRSWIYTAVRAGTFPEPTRLSHRCARWDSDLVDQWIARCLKTGAQ